MTGRSDQELTTVSINDERQISTTAVVHPRKLTGSSQSEAVAG
jgi:hypothetical protein